MKSHIRRIKSLFLTVSLPLILCLTLAGVMFSQINNTLINNGKWTSSKSTLGKAVYGANEFISSYQALAHNQLDLGSWYGYQEVIIKKMYPIYLIDVDFFLTDKSYFYFIFNKSASQFSAIRISNNKNYPDSYVIVKRSGEFQSIYPLKSPKLESGKWNHLQVLFDSTNKSVLIKINNKENMTIHVNFPENQRFGFKGSYTSTYIDTILVKGIDGQTLFKDDFDYGDGCFIIFYLICVFIGIICALLFKMKNSRTNSYPISIFLFVAGVVMLIIESYLWFVLLKSYPNPHSTWNRVMDTVLRRDVMVTNHNETLAKKVLMKKYDDKPKILFVGTSQTWGAGAENEDEDFVKIAEIDANREGNKYSFINAGIAGVDSTMLFSYYERKWIISKPYIVALNVSNNDVHDSSAFRNNLNKFIRLNKSNNIRTIFILEANSPETEPRSILLHPIMREIAKKEGIPIIDLNGYLAGKDNSGLIWWDNVHLTTYGHELAGHFIYNNLIDMLKDIDDR